MLVVVVALLWLHGARDAVEPIVRWTARISLLFFLGAFVSGATPALRPSKPGFLVALALSHLVHALAIAALAFQTSGANLAERGAFVILGGAVGYWIIGLAALRPESDWAGVGLYGVWGIFFLAYLPRALASPAGFGVAVLMLGASLVYRLVQARRQAAAA